MKTSRRKSLRCLEFEFRRSAKVSTSEQANKIENLETEWIRRADKHEVYFSEPYGKHRITADMADKTLERSIFKVKGSAL